MGKFAQDIKNLILGNDGSDKEPLDFKSELQKAIKEGKISKADGTLLITSRTNSDKFAELIAREEEKEVIEAGKENGKEYNFSEGEFESKKEKDEKKREKERQDKIQKDSLEQQIEASKNATRARMEAEKNLGKITNDKERKS